MTQGREQQASGPALDENALWRRRDEENDLDAEARLIEMYLPHARRLAAGLYSKRPDDEVPFDDYFQWASLGLIEAVKRYDFSADAAFTTFASFRIRGAVLNGLEKATERRDQASFVRRNRLSRVESLQESTGRDDKNSLFSEMVNLMAELAIGLMLESESATDSPGLRNAQLESTSLIEVRRRIDRIIEDLPANERMVILYHYFYQVPFIELATRLNITKGRVSQIHKRALERIRTLLAAKSGLDDYF